MFEFTKKREQMALSKKPYKGCRDFFPKEMKTRRYIFNKMQNSCELFGYEEYDLLSWYDS